MNTVQWTEVKNSLIFYIHMILGSYVPSILTISTTCLFRYTTLIQINLQLIQIKPYETLFIFQQILRKDISANPYVHSKLYCDNVVHTFHGSKSCKYLRQHHVNGCKLSYRFVYTYNVLMCIMPRFKMKV